MDVRLTFQRVFVSDGLLGKAYKNLTEASRSEWGHTIPSRVQRYLNNLTNFEYVATIAEWVGQADDILLIGDAGGRDYYSLSAQGKRVTVLDIAPQVEIRPFVLSDINEGMPFKSNHFGAVVMAEVVEHLFEDFLALREIRRVLRPDGVLILTTPIGNDAPDYHVRVYTPKTFTRLLEYSGFQVREVVLKGGGFAAADAMLLGAGLKHMVQYLFWRVTGRTRYRLWNRTLRKLDLWAARRFPLVHKWSRHYGMFVLATPTEATRDFRELNRHAFAHRF